MTFPTDDIFLGPQSFGRRPGTEGIIWHTTEAATTSRDSAIATANWQKSNPGSYNWIIFDGGLLLTVPYLEASGGVNPFSSAWAPGRYPFLKAQLTDAAYANPNAHLLNVAFSGKTAIFRDFGIPDNMIETAQRLTEWVIAQPWCSRMVHSGHMHWQTNRSDPSQYVLNRITGGDVPIFTRPVREQWTMKAGSTFWTGGPEMGESKTYNLSDKLWSNGETTDGVWRRFEFGAEELWFKRADITPVSGTRNPTTGYGNPTLSTGHTDAELAAAKASGVTAGKADMKAKAIVAGENHVTVLRALK